MAQMPASSVQDSSHVLETHDLRAHYRMKYFGIDREVRAVDGISMHVRKNEVYGIAGESSCGKTTFIKAIAAAIRPPLEIVAGHVNYSFIKGDLYAMPAADRSAIRWRHLSYILQGSMNVLNPVRRIHKTFEDFAFRHMHLGRAEFDQAVKHHLERLRLPAEILRAYPHELSGGMRQRVCIALATLCKPEIIIADEPTTALDVVVQKDVLAMIRETQSGFGSSMIFVTHDLTVHANVTDRLGIMYAGRLVEEGRTADVFANPMHPYTAHLIASLPKIGDTQSRNALSGSPPNLADPPKGCRFHPRCPLAMEICRYENPALTTLAEDHRVACFAASTKVQPANDEGSGEAKTLEMAR